MTTRLAILLVYIFTIGIHKLDLNLGFATIPWLVFLPFVKGADKDTFKRMNVPILVFIAACMSIGSVANYLGLGEVIAIVCNQLLSGSTNPFAILAVVFALVFGLNFLMTPSAIVSLITVPVCMLAVNAGLSPIPFVYAMSACSEAVIFPYEYVPYLVIYAFGMMHMKDFIKTNILRSALFFAGYLLLLVPYWYLIGLF